MRRFLRMIVLSALIVAIIGMSGSVIAKSEKKYINQNGLYISTESYDRYLALGFTKEEIEYMTEDEIDDLDDVIPLKVDRTEEYTLVKYGVDNKGNKFMKESKLSKKDLYEEINMIKKAKKEKKESEITLSLGHDPFVVFNDLMMLSNDCEYYDTEKVCYTDFEAYRMTTNVVATSLTTMFIKNTVDWIEMPSTREYDVIGFTFPHDYALVQYQYRGKQTWTYQEVDGGVYIVGETRNSGYANYTNSTTPSYFDVSSPYDGIAMKQNLKDDIYSSQGLPLQVVMQMQNSIWAKVANVESEPLAAGEFYDVSGIYHHCYLDYGISSLSFNVISGGITVGTTWALKYEENSNLVQFEVDELDLSSFPYVSIYTPYVSFFNDNDVFIDGDLHKNLRYMGFQYSEIKTLNQTEADYYQDFNATTYVSKLNNTSEYKDFRLYVTTLDDGTYFVKATMVWERVPSSRDYDLIAIDLPSLSSLESYTGRHVYQSASSTDISVTRYSDNIYNFNATNYGIIMRSNLQSSTYQYLLVSVEGVFDQYSSSSDDRVDAYYMHMTDNIYMRADYAYIPGNYNTGIHFYNYNYYGYYDTMYKVENLSFY
jgi:hypothetical protein